ncbi:MAG: DUF4190 domain-containing protein [Pirellulales bacterium]
MTDSDPQKQPGPPDGGDEPTVYRPNLAKPVDQPDRSNPSGQPDQAGSPSASGYQLGSPQPPADPYAPSDPYSALPQYPTNPAYDQTQIAGQQQYPYPEQYPYPGQQPYTGGYPDPNQYGAGQYGGDQYNAYGGQPYPGGAYPGAYGQPVAPTGNDGLAITSLVLGICTIVLGWFCLGLPLGIAAIVTGVIALGRLKTNGRQGRGLAIAGIATGAVGIIISIVIAIIVVGVEKIHVDGNALLQLLLLH